MNQFSISSAGIGDALKRSASSLKASGNTIDESIAMITAANVVVQDPDVIGTALKTLSLRLTSTTAELEAMGEETEFACETLSDYRNLVLGLTKNEVDILGDDGQYKNTYNIIKEISEVWKDMDSMSQSSLMKSLFGVRQANVGVSLIEQFDTAEKVLQASINSQGSAMEEHSRWMQSAEAKINQFRASFESLSQTIINSDFLKSLIDSGTSFLNVVENIIDKLNVLPLILGSISSGLAVKNVGLFQVVNDKTSDGGQQIVTVLKARKIAQMEATEQLNLDIDCLRKYEDRCKVGAVTADDFAETMQHASLSAQDYAEKIKNGTGSVDAYVSSQQKMQSATKASTVATKALSVAMNALVVIAATKAIGFAVEQIDKWIVTAEEAKEMSEDLVTEYNNALETANANAKSAKNLENRYKELSKGVGSFGENLSLTTEEYNEYNVLVNQIADMFPTLVQGYTDEGNAILSLKGNVEQLRDAYKEAQQEAYNLLIANGENSDGDSIIKNWDKLHNTDFWGWVTDLGAVDAGKSISKSDAIKQLEAIQNMSAERYREILDTVAHGSRKNISKFSEIEKDIVYDSYIPNALGIDVKVTDEEFAQAKKQAKALVQTYNAEIQNALQDVESLANAYLETSGDYKKLDSQTKASVSKLINNLDEQIASSFKDKNDVGIYVDGILQSVLSNDETANALNKLFAIDIDNMPISEAKQHVDKYINAISDSLGENADNLKIRLGFENVDDLETRYNAIISKFNAQEQDTISSFFTDNSINTTEKLDYWQSVTEHTQTAQDAIEAYNTALKETVKEKNKEVDFTTLKEGLEEPLSQIDKIKSAMQTLANGELLEWSDASELMFDIDTERVLGDFEEIDGKYRLIGNDISSLIKLKDKLIQKQIDEIELQKQSQEKLLKDTQIKLATAKSQLSRSNSASDAKYWNEQISDIESQMVQINSLTRDYNYLIGYLNSQLGDTVDHATALKERMEKVQESADKYADAMTKQVDDIIDNLQDEQDILEEQKSALEEQLDVLEEQKSELEDIIDKHKDIVDVIGEEVEREKKLLEEQRDAEEEAIQAKIDALKESKEKQEEDNDLVEKELELQKKLADLEKAKQTKVRTFSQARGWHYDVDKEAVANAQTAVADAQKTYDDAVAEKVFSDQIEALEKQKETIGETYEEQLKAYENYYEEWKAILDEEINAENERIAVEIMGSDWREKIKKRDSSILNSFASSFRSYNNQLKNLVSNEIANLKESIIAKEEEIKAKQKQIKVWQDYKDQVDKSIDDIKNKYDDYISYLDGITLNENSTYEDREAALRNFVENYGSCISEIQDLQSSLQDLSTTIDVYVNTDTARSQMADFMEMYRDGVVGMYEMLKASSTGYGVVNSAWDAQLAEAANQMIEWGTNIDETIARLRGYSTGGVNDNTGIVKLHGEKQRVETVFNAQQGRYLYDMVKTGNFSNLVAQKAIEGLKGAKMSNLTNNNSNDRIINIQNMTIKADNPTQFHDQFMKEIGQYWRVQLAESKVK